MGLLCRFEVGAQSARLAEVDVLGRVALVGVVVDEHADDPASAPGTGTSRAHSSGTRSKPRPRAATAGNSASRSSVSVKMQLTTSSGPMSLRAMISRMSSSVAARMAGAWLASTVVAPRRAKRRIGRHHASHAPCGRRPACLPGRLRRGRQARLPSPFGAARAHHHEPRLPRQRRDPSALLVRRRQGAAQRCASPACPPARPSWRSSSSTPTRAASCTGPRTACRPATRALGATGLPAGAREGENSTGATGWTPPCPPSGNHRYEFRLYWLKRASGLDAGAKPDDVIAAVRGKRGRQRPARGPLRARAEARARSRAGAGPRPR